MSTINEPAAKYRNQAEELRAEAAKTTDPVMRETLLDAAKAREEMAAPKTRKPKPQ
jgi:hypothetical protein